MALGKRRFIVLVLLWTIFIIIPRCMRAQQYMFFIDAFKVKDVTESWQYMDILMIIEENGNMKQVVKDNVYFFYKDGQVEEEYDAFGYRYFLMPFYNQRRKPCVLLSYDDPRRGLHLIFSDVVLEYRCYKVLVK